MSARPRLLWLAGLGVTLLAGCQLRADPDRDLAARFELSAVPGIRFVRAEGERLPPGRFCAGTKATCPDPQRGYDINWTSAPDGVVPIRVAPEIAADAQVLLRNEAGAPLLLARGSTVVFAMEPATVLRSWSYFNYLLHSAASDAAGVEPAPFAKWAGSPMPQGGARTAYFLGVAGIWVALVAFFRLARRRGRARPLAAEEFFRAVDAAARGRGKEAPSAGWAQAGFVRPLAGFLTLLATMSFMAGAYLLLQWLLGNRIQPFPQADGLWRTAFDALIAVSLLFEFGTNFSSVKHFAEERVRDPAKALAHLQFYVWWQFFQRAAQITLLGAAALFLVPESEYAIYAPFVALFALKGLTTSVFQLGRLVCSALQRFDYHNLLEMADSRLLVYLVPAPFVLLGRAWGAAHPVYGEIFGAALGLALGHTAANLVAMLLGFWVLARLRIPIGHLFLGQFDHQVSKRQLTFGGKLALGSEPIFLIRSVEAMVIIKLLQDFTTWQGVQQLLSGSLYMLFSFGGSFYGGSLAPISEAFAAGKRHLVQYYVARFFQFGMLFQVAIFSMIMAVGPSFIRAMGPQWARAIPYLGIAMFGGLMSAPVWLSDSLQRGAGRGWTNAVSMLIEHGSRLGMLLVLVPRLGFAGLLLASVGGFTVKTVLGWTLNHLTIVPLRLSLFGNFVGPAAAGLVNYALWWAVMALWAPTSTAAVLGFMCVASALSFFVCFWVAGMAGGYDAVAIQELRAAGQMVSFAGPLARSLSVVARTGARWGLQRPGLRDLAVRAQEEAAELDLAASKAANLAQAMSRGSGDDPSTMGSVPRPVAPLVDGG